MATSNSRDVKMTLSVETLGADDINKLQGSVAALAKEGGDAAPEFQHLADEIGRLGEQAAALRAFQALSDETAQLAARQAEAAVSAAELKTKWEALSATTEELRANQRLAATALADAKATAAGLRDELATLSATTDRAAKSEKEYIQTAQALKVAKIEQRAEVERLSTALAESNAKVTQAEQSDARLEKQYRNSTSALGSATSAIERNTRSLQESGAAATRLGVDIEDIAAAEAKLTQGLNQAGSAASTFNTKISESADYVRFWKEAMYQAEAQAERTSSAAKLAGQKISDALGVLGVRSAEQLQAEILQVRAAMDTVRNNASQTGSAISGAFSAGEAKIKSLERELRQVSGALTTADKAASLFKNSLGQIAAGNIIADGVGYLVNKVKELGAAFVSTIVQTEQLRKGLNAVYKDTAVAGAQFDFLKKTADTAGISVGNISQSFLKFSAATKSSGISLDESNKLFAAVTRATSSLGLGADAAGGALDALGQIASKGVVSMEELRQQLGDRVPGALSLTAQGLGITEAQLNKLVESGGLAARDFFPAFTKGLNTLQGSTEGLVPAWERLKNAFRQTAEGAGDSGWTQIMSTGLKGLAIVIGTVVMPLSALSEGVLFVARAAGTLAAAVVTMTNPLDELSKMATGVGARLDKLSESFLSAAGVVTAAAEADHKKTLALQAMGKAALESSTGIADTAKAQQVQAFASKLAADSTFDHSQKIVHLNTFISELLSTQTKQIEASAKLVAASKIEGDTLITLAELRGNETKTLESRVRASELLVASTAKSAEAHRAETEILIIQRSETEKERVLMGLKLDDYKTELEAIDKKIIASAAETEQSKQAADAALKERASRQLASEVYKDNAKNLELFKNELAAVNKTLAEYERLALNGKRTQEQVNEVKLRAAVIEGKIRDALSDSIKLLERESQAKSASLNIDIARTSVAQKHAEVMAQEMRASGNIAAAIYYEVEAKQLQIKGIKLATELKKLELEADTKIIEVERLKLTSTGDRAKLRNKRLTSS
jgi:tape measure domain-containing protein